MLLCIHALYFTIVLGFLLLMCSTRSRYKTCLVEDPQFPDIMACEISKIRFEDKALKMQKGPIETDVTFNYFKLFSRNFNNEKAYPKNELAL